MSFHRFEVAFLEMKLSSFTIRCSTLPYLAIKTPFQRKFLSSKILHQILSISPPNSHKSFVEGRKTGRLERTELIKAILPANKRNLPLQRANLDLSLPIKGFHVLILLGLLPIAISKKVKEESSILQDKKLEVSKRK